MPAFASMTITSRNHAAFLFPATTKSAIKESMSGGLKIYNSDDLKDWLQKKPQAWSRAIITRAALRVIPYIVSDSYLTITIYRYLIISSIMTETFNKDLIIAAKAARSTPHGSPKGWGVEGGRAMLAVEAALDSVYATNADAAAIAALGGRFAANAISASADWEGIESDIGWLTNTKTSQPVAELMMQPLSIFSSYTSIFINKLFQQQQRNSSLLEAGFAPWFDWYAGLVPLPPYTEVTDVFGPGLSRRIALQPNEWWEREPKDVNADIARWLEEKSSAAIAVTWGKPPLDEEITETAKNPPEQRPAAYRFVWQEGRLAPLPPDAARDAADAAVMLDELRRKLAEFSERLPSTNVHPRIPRSIAQLMAVIPEDTAVVNPLLLWSRGQSIRADAQHFMNSDELADDVKSHLTDIAAAVAAVGFCYPTTRELETEARAASLDEGEAGRLLAELAVLREAVAAAPEIFDPATVDALDVMAEAPEAPADYVKSAAGKLWLANRLLVAGNALAELARGAATRIYDTIAVLGSKAGKVWSGVRPQFAARATEALVFIRTPTGYCALASVLVAVYPLATGVAVLGFPAVAPLIDRAIKHLKKLGEEPPKDGA